MCVFLRSATCGHPGHDGSDECNSASGWRPSSRLRASSKTLPLTLLAICPLPCRSDACRQAGFQTRTGGGGQSCGKKSRARTCSSDHRQVSSGSASDSPIFCSTSWRAFTNCCGNASGAILRSDGLSPRRSVNYRRCSTSVTRQSLSGRVEARVRIQWRHFRRCSQMIRSRLPTSRF